MSKVEEKIKKYSNAVSANVVAATFDIPIDSKVTQAIKRQHQAFINDLEEIKAEQEELQKEKDILEAQISELSERNRVLNEQLQEQSKPVEVPKFVAEWYEENKEDLEYSIWAYVYELDSARGTEFHKWMNTYLNKPIETLIRMKNGYTVQQEQLYYMPLPFQYNKTLYYCINESGKITFGQGNLKSDIYKFTKEQIEQHFPGIAEQAIEVNE